MKKTLFIALDLSEKVKHSLFTLTQKLAQKYHGVRWIQKQDFHITIKYLGPTTMNPQKINNMFKKRIEILHISPFTITLSSLSIFINKSAVIFVHVKSSPSLLQMYHAANNSLEELGFTRERKTYHPHVTLGRVKEAETSTIQQLISMPNQTIIFPELIINDIALFASQTNVTGSNYSKLFTIPLVV